jgi:DNA excision repair protein ERCC-2
MRLGQEVHDRFRAQARKVHPGYSEEVFVRWEGERQGYRVRVEGRIDGLYPEEPATGTKNKNRRNQKRHKDEAPARSLVLQEIKSVLAPDLGELEPGAEDSAGTGAQDPSETTGRPRSPQLLLEDLMEDLPDPVLAAYQWQCALYCHFLALGRAAAGEAVTLRGELVLVDARSLRSQAIAVPYEPESCQAFLEARLDALLGERAEAERLQRVRLAYSERVRFPHPSLRPYQQELMDNVAGAAEGGMALLMSAPTGIGKTAAALVPLLGSALATNRRLMVVTAKVSQQELALDTLGALVAPGEEILVAQLEARERSCPREEMLCTEHACPLLRQSLLVESLAPVAKELRAGGVFRAEALRLMAATRRLCPFEVGLFAAGLADVVVCDFNYAFHPQASLDRFFAPGGRERLLLVDEAHNLPARARDFLSPTLDRARIRVLAEGALQGGHPVFARILEFLLDVESLITDTEREVDAGPRRGLAVAEVELDRERTASLETATETWLLDYLAWAKSGTRRPPAFVPRTVEGSRRVLDPFLGFCFDLLHFCRAAEERGDHTTTLLRRSAETTELQILCKDPSRYLASRHRRFHSVVAMSATLEPLDFFADELGVSRLRSFECCAFPSPFPPENRAIVVDGSLSTRFRDRDRSLPEACRRMAKLAALKKGNYLAFFPSYALLEAGALLIRASDPTIGVVTQTREGGAEPLLKALEEAARAPTRRSLVGAAVIGGALSEGVDFVGELAIGAFLFGPGLPAVTDERKIIQEYYEQERGAGFEYAFLYPGLARVVQAAGRVIRGPDERGIIVLFCERFTDPRYRDQLPAYWRAEALDTDDPVPVVSAFWARGALNGVGPNTQGG